MRHSLHHHVFEMRGTFSDFISHSNFTGYTVWGAGRERVTLSHHWWKCKLVYVEIIWGLFIKILNAHTN